MVATAHDETGSKCVTADEHHELHVLERDGDAWRSCALWRVRLPSRPGALCLAARQHTLARASTFNASAVRAAQAHDATLRGVAWASPVFGSMLASCSDDGAVRVWLLQPSGGVKPIATLGGAPGAAPVVCVAFAPQHHGLVIAAGCADGVVRLYESVDRTGASGWDEQVRSLRACCAKDTC